MIASCDTGDIATGGGYFSEAGADISLNRPVPNDTGDTPIAWEVGSAPTLSGPLPAPPNTVTAYVVCADITP
ncbi:hypothetical protein ACIPSA_08965 [Streptomyces sp. NPDC086549]|uniref:hypothetical protein n=1 Tax=Streptomyces sp. NPDC086549 TaxID=3365752 RepID=UPI003819D2AE